MKENEKFMGYAIQEGEKAISEGNFPFGCCIVNHNGEVVMTHNKVITSQSSMAHAEMLALWEIQKKSNLDSRKWSIYCTTKPCIMCLGAIYWSGIRTVIYGTDIIVLKEKGIDDIDYDEKNLNYVLKKVNLIGGCMERECTDLLNKWYKKNKLQLAYLNFRRKTNESE